MKQLGLDRGAALDASALFEKGRDVLERQIAVGRRDDAILSLHRRGRTTCLR